MTVEERANLVAFIKPFRRGGRRKRRVIQFKFRRNGTEVGSIQHGKELFQKLECWKCTETKGA